MNLTLNEEEVELVQAGLKELMQFLNLSKFAYSQAREDKNADKAFNKYMTARDLYDRISEEKKR